MQILYGLFRLKTWYYNINACVLCILPYFKCIVELKEQHQHENNLRTKIVVRNTDFRNFSSYTCTLWCILSIFSVYCLPIYPHYHLFRLLTNHMHIIFQCRKCSIRNKCRNNQMDDNIFDKRLLKRNCFMINKHFNRHYIWIVINVILSKASPVFQEKNQYMYLYLFCMLNLCWHSRESQESHFIECVKCSTEKMCTVYIKTTHARTHAHKRRIGDHLWPYFVNSTEADKRSVCVKISKSIALEHETVDALSFIITVQILVCDECRLNREQLAHVLDALNDWKLPNDAVEHDFNAVNKLQANRAWITFQTNCCWFRLFMGDESPKYIANSSHCNFS